MVLKLPVVTKNNQEELLIFFHILLFFFHHYFLYNKIVWLKKLILQMYTFKYLDLDKDLDSMNK